ncbi:hypothetical protein AACH10_05095 [Ideonella sp. DXS22W]|uniref:Uncharacterized protein n=1 Tax=Pseudaquabacterium inlustre TaxID=2984192 RepID=A0ABU9CD18_9BURK
MTAPTIALDAVHLNAAIDAVSAATAQLSLSPAAHRRYRALLICTDGMLWCAVLIVGVVFLPEQLTWKSLAGGLLGLVFALLGVVALGLLLLNWRLVWRTWVEHRQLHALGVAGLAESAWRARRRRRWGDRLRSVVVLVLALLLVLLGVVFLQPGQGLEAMAAVVLVSAPLLLLTRYLRRCREQMALATEAGALAQTLAALRPANVAQGKVEVPAELLHQAAGIENAQIAAARQDAIMRSDATRATACVIRFDAAALAQRAALAAPLRLALDDLLADLSADGPAAAAGGAGSDAGARVYRAEGLAVTARLEEGGRTLRIQAIEGSPPPPPATADASPSEPRHAA